MPDSLDKYIAIEKNKLASAGAWLWLLEVAIEGESTIYLVNNLEDLTYQGQTYTACNFQMEPYDKSEPHRLADLTLNVTNTDLVAGLLPYVNDYDGIIGATITRTPVHTAHLDIDMSAKSEDFVVMSCSAGEEWISFVLGAPNPLNRKFPNRRFFSLYCRYVGRFKGIECGYSGAETSCNGTPEDCEDNKNNLERFGGQLALRSKTIRFT